MLFLINFSIVEQTQIVAINLCYVMLCYVVFMNRTMTDGGLVLSCLCLRRCAMKISADVNFTSRRLLTESKTASSTVVDKVAGSSSCEDC